MISQPLKRPVLCRVSFPLKSGYERFPRADPRWKRVLQFGISDKPGAANRDFAHKSSPLRLRHRIQATRQTKCYCEYQHIAPSSLNQPSLDELYAYIPIVYIPKPILPLQHQPPISIDRHHLVSQNIFKRNSKDCKKKQRLRRRGK